jgi:Holliday junction resolvasome RuvABC ATP-dependent DNA helicase subunit
VAPLSAQGLAKAIGQLDYKDILFIDDIDRASGLGATALTTLLESRALHLADGDPLAAEITVFGATTRVDRLGSAVVDCFPVVEHIAPYSQPDLTRVVIRIAYAHLSGDLIDDFDGYQDRRRRDHASGGPAPRDRCSGPCGRPGRLHHR